MTSHRAKLMFVGNIHWHLHHRKLWHHNFMIQAIGLMVSCQLKFDTRFVSDGPQNKFEKLSSNLWYPTEMSFVFTTRLPDTCPSSGKIIIKHLSYDYSETSMEQCHRDLHRSFVGLQTRLTSRGGIVIDSLVVNTKDVSGHHKVTTCWSSSIYTQQLSLPDLTFSFSSNFKLSLET